MLEPVLARFHSVLLIGHLRHSRLQEDLQRAYDRKVAPVEASEFGACITGRNTRARRARRDSVLTASLVPGNLNLDALGAAS